MSSKKTLNLQQSELVDIRANKLKRMVESDTEEEDDPFFKTDDFSTDPSSRNTSKN